MTDAGNDVVIPREGVHDHDSTSGVAPVETRLLEVWLPILIVVGLLTAISVGVVFLIIHFAFEKKDVTLLPHELPPAS